MNRAKVDAQAWRDLLAITSYLADVALNRRAAHEVAREFDRKAASYARQPTMGDIRDDLGEHLRSFTFRRWNVAVYEPIDDGIRVIRVFDGRRDYGPLVSDSELE